MTDRPLRPLFPKGYLYDTQIITTLLSADGENDPDILSINGASAALMVSDIPFAGPIGALRVGRIDGQFITNPTHTQMELSDLDLVYVATETEILMIEGSALELPEADFKAALAYAQEEAQIVIRLQKELAARVNKAKRSLPLYEVKPELADLAYEIAGSRIEAAIYRPTKIERLTAVKALKDEVEAAIKAGHPNATPFDINSAFGEVEKKAFRIAILDQQKRSDGRGAAEIRPLTAKSACSRARTVPPSSPAARPRRSAWPRSRPATKPRTSTATPAVKSASGSSSTTTSLPFPWAKPAASAD